MTKQKTKQLLKLLQELKEFVRDTSQIEEVENQILEMARHDENCVCPDCCAIS